MVILILIPSTIIAQTDNTSHKSPFAFSVHGGYSWLDGVIGADFQSGLLGISGGWMPTTMPISGTRINSTGIALSLYSNPPTESSAFYLSIGVNSHGYRYEDSFGNAQSKSMAIVMGGWKYNVNMLYLKMGSGYGWCDEAGVWTAEITLGINLFKNYK